MSELKPCPFCGVEIESFSMGIREDSSGNKRTVTQIKHPVNMDCDLCGLVFEKSKWNTRTTTKDKEFAACREALDFAVHRQEIGETDWLSDAKQTLSNIQKEAPHDR